MSDDEVHAIAVAQLGLCTREQALRGGLAPHQIEHRLATGRWEAVERGVYRLAGNPPSWHQQLLAACLSVGPSAAVSHRAAAQLLDVRLRTIDLDLIELSVAKGRTPRRASMIVHRSGDLDDDQITYAGPIPVTTPARLLVDLGQCVPHATVDRALDQLLASRRVTVQQVRLALAAHSRRGRNGCGVLRQVLERRSLLDEVPESVLEAAFLALCRAHGLELPVLQHEVTLPSGRRRLDAAYPAQRVAIELDGYAFHSTPGAFEEDRLRASELTARGWSVLRFTWQQVVHRPEWVAATVGSTLRSRTRDAA